MAEVNVNDIIGTMANAYATVESAKISAGLSQTTPQQNTALNSVPMPANPQQETATMPADDKKWLMLGGAALVGVVLLLVVMRR